MDLREVGKRLSAESVSKIKAAMQALQDLMGEIMDDQMASTEALRRALQEAEMSHDDVRNALRQALKAKYDPTDKRWYYIQDVYDSWFVYQDDDPPGDARALYKASYAIVDGKVTLGDPVKVVQVTTYQPVSEADRLAEKKTEADETTESGEFDIGGDCIPLVEASVRRDGTIPLKIIKPGWGTSGYYGPEVLKRDGPKVFTAGTKMFWDHPTVTEEAERPERSLRDLAAEFVDNAVYQESGPAGPGLYANAKVFGPFKETVAELAPHIGVSIRGRGLGVDGEAEGKKGKIIEKITLAQSVDFVTQAGAGGQILPILEAARGRTTNEEVSTVDEQEAQKLREAEAALKAENARLKEALVLREARDFASEVLAEAKLPGVTKSRLIENLAVAPVIKDGALDKEAYKTKITEAVKAEIDYLAKVTGSGEIRGMGSTGESTVSEAKVEADLEASFKAMGLGESAAKVAAKGRN